MPPVSSPVPPQRRFPWGRLVVACCMGAVLLAPRGVTVVVLSDAKRPLVMRADVQGDSAVSAPIKPCASPLCQDRCRLYGSGCRVLDEVCPRLGGA